MNIIFLITSVFLGAGRSIFSKKMPFSSINSRRFYINQGILFLSSAIGIYLFNLNAFKSISHTTIIYGMIFGIVTFLAQWCYTVALNKGPTSICAMIYAFGFIFPTVSGALFWNEPFGFTSVLGIAIVISSIIVSSFSGDKKGKTSNSFIIPNLIAMISAGTLGILQKIHQSSHDKGNLGAFLIIAFLLATVISFLIAIICDQKTEEKISINAIPILAGFCFGLVSMLNTLLAGRMSSAVLFPTLNIGVMMACFVAGIIIFKEKPSRPQIIAFGLGILAIIVLSI